MKIDIWSDIMCPFCYIGKRRFEAALSAFAFSEKVSVEWHSFQLDPDIQHGDGKSLYAYLSERKGISLEQSIDMHRRVTGMAKEAGLEYHFDKAVVANSFDAHRLIQFAKTAGKGDEAEERLFHAYFTEGKDMSDHKVLAELGKDIGLTVEQTSAALNDDQYAYKVKQDIDEAARLGIRGVPFFIFNRKYAVSGSQPKEIFLEALKQSFDDWEREKEKGLHIVTADGAACAPDGKCD